MMSNDLKKYFIENYTQHMEQERDDLSSSLIHMTKNQECLKEILKTQKLISSIDVPYCIPQKNRDIFKTVSFTEMPLSQILKINVPPFNTKSNRMTYYGLEFHRKNFQENYTSLNPVLYIFNEQMKKNYCRLFSMDFNSTNQINFQQVAPYIKFVSPTNNFYWEREWRYLGDFEFSLHEIKYILVPTEIDADSIAKSFTNYPTLVFKVLQDSRKVIVYEFNDNITEEEMLTNIKGYYNKISIDENENIEESVFKTLHQSFPGTDSIVPQIVAVPGKLCRL